MQGDACDVCKGTNKSGRRPVDHNHATGKIRGLLCDLSNLALARIEAVLLWYEKAQNYLERYDDDNLHS